MIKNYIKNICLIGFALFGPIYLPAGGIQKNLNNYSNFNKSKEIVLNKTSSIYAMPVTNSKELRSMKIGSSLYVLRHWTSPSNKKWIRVQVVNSIFDNNPDKPLKGWLKT